MVLCVIICLISKDVNDSNGPILEREKTTFLPFALLNQHG